jgi:thymidylate synthase ThyX
VTVASAKIIADSISPNESRLITLQVTIHRFVLSEFNTHRAFSRNSASSRAIPVKKQIDRVLNDPAIPISWPLEQPGMQGGAELSTNRDYAIREWLIARDHAVESVRQLQELGVHKSITNRLLEPWMWQVIVCSSTEWQNFFDQRATRFSPFAQPEMRAAADAMFDAIESSSPVLVQPGEWHLPYVDEDEFNLSDKEDGPELGELEMAKMSSVARCARVSTLNQEGKRDLDSDLKLYDRLAKSVPPHASPLEHIATPLVDGPPMGNFAGWRQLRHIVLNNVQP